MMFSRSAEYAFSGLSELSIRPQDKPVMLADLVTGTSMPRDFLAKVFGKLVTAGVLTSAKGRGGGYRLARPPHEITLAEIVGAIDGVHPSDSCVDGFAECHDLAPCPQHDLHKPIRQRLKDYLDTTTLADLAASLKAVQQCALADGIEATARRAPGGSAAAR